MIVLFQILSSRFNGCKLLQDYHRFHVPVSGTIEKFVDIPGCLYTVWKDLMNLLKLVAHPHVFLVHLQFSPD